MHLNIETRVALWRLKHHIKAIHITRLLTQIGVYKKEKLDERVKRHIDKCEECKKIIFSNLK